MAKQIQTLRYRCADLTPLLYEKKHSLKTRRNANQRGYNYRWQQASKRFLTMNPLCKDCEAEGRVVASQVVDHIKPHKDDQTLFWDANNWQPLCRKHHSQKTAREDGGFGNPQYLL